MSALALVAFLYYRPLQSYLETRDTLAQRVSEVRALRAEKRRLQARVTLSASKETLAREARRIGFVKPGETLYIVKGIPEWRRARARR